MLSAQKPDLISMDIHSVEVLTQIAQLGASGVSQNSILRE
jgi:hypothetical protein